MTIRRLSLVLYSAIVASYLMKIFQKFKVSFNGHRMKTYECQPPYTAIHFVKTWHNGTGNSRTCSKTLVLGPELRTLESKTKLYQFCEKLNCKCGYCFSHVATISWAMSSDGESVVGNTSSVSDILDSTDIMHIMGLFYELLAMEK